MCYDPYMQLLSERPNLRSLPAVSFATLMELYEANYIRLRRLIPDLEHCAGHTVSRIPDGLDLHLRIVERSRFTTTISLNHGFEGGGLDASPMPAMRIRIYHDARLVEALSGDTSVAPSLLHHRWKCNRFLQHWLSHCLSRRHRFVHGRAHSDESEADSGLTA